MFRDKKSMNFNFDKFVAFIARNKKLVRTYAVSRRYSPNYIYSNMRELWANHNEP